LFELANHPVCAAKERDLIINGAATPPLKGGEWDRLATSHYPPPRRKLWDSSGVGYERKLKYATMVLAFGEPKCCR
jgi:hypothetical protein